jgi:diamine N-acetyltransferase
MIFQPATRNDIDLLLQFNQALNEHDGTQADTAKIHAGLLGLLEHPEWGQIWLIMQEQQAIGYLVLTWGYSLEFGGRDAFIDELYLVPAARGRGLGQQILQFAAEQCRANGIQAVHLEVDADNHQAQNAYDRAGFVRRGNYFLMTKDIQGSI